MLLGLGDAAVGGLDLLAGIRRLLARGFHPLFKLGNELGGGAGLLARRLGGSGNGAFADAVQTAAHIVDGAGDLVHVALGIGLHLADAAGDLGKVLLQGGDGAFKRLDRLHADAGLGVGSGLLELLEITAQARQRLCGARVRGFNVVHHIADGTLER